MKRAKVLVVDDEPVIRSLLSDVLREEGLDVTVAKGGEEGIEKARNDCFDLVFTDIHMPDIDGIEVLRAVKGMNKPTQVILMDSYPDSLVEKGLSLGAYDCLHKPFELESLRSILEDLVK